MAYGSHHIGAGHKYYDQCEYILLSMENVFQIKKLFYKSEDNLPIFKFETVKTKHFFFQKIKILFHVSRKEIL